MLPDVVPDTRPFTDPTVATELVLLLQIPPAIELLNVLVEPAHIVVVPAITPGDGLTVTTVVV